MVILAPRIAVQLAPSAGRGAPRRDSAPSRSTRPFLASRPIAAITVWLLPEPDSPTIATVSPRHHVEVDALDRMHLAVGRVESARRGRGLEHRTPIGARRSRSRRPRHLSGPSGRARRAGRRRGSSARRASRSGRSTERSAASWRAGMFLAPSAISTPQLVIGSCTPRPRKERKLSRMITCGTSSVM